MRKLDFIALRPVLHTFSPTYNIMTFLGNIHCYTDDSIVHGRCSGHFTVKLANIKEKRQEFVPEFGLDLSRITQRANENLVEFNAMKTQVCAFPTKKFSFLSLPTFQNTQLLLQDKLDILCMDICWNLNPREYTGYRHTEQGETVLLTRALVTLSSLQDAGSLLDGVLY